MTSAHRLSGIRSRREFKSLLVILLVLAGSLKGFAQTEFSEHEYNMFRSFYYDSFNVVIELAGESELRLSPEDFGKLPEDTRREICSIVTDYRTFQLVAADALFLSSTFGEERANSLVTRLTFDLADVKWVPLGEVAPEDQPKVIKALSDLKRFILDGLDVLDSKMQQCLGWFLADSLEADPDFKLGRRLTPAYASVPAEFRLREFYRSQLPVLIWILDNTRASEERDRLREFIHSMKRKYLLEP